MSPSESHDQEMELVFVGPSPVPTYPQPTAHESSDPQIKEENEEVSKRKLLPSDSNISIPPFPYSHTSEEPTLSESAPPSPRPPPQPHQVQTPTPESPTDDDGADSTHPILEIVEKQEHGKAVIVLAVPMVMGLVTSHDSIGKITEMKVVAVTLCFAFASIWNGILLRKTYRTASPLFLLIGISLMNLSFYAFLGCILPVSLKWVPVSCWILSVAPLVPVFVALISSWKKKAKVASKERDLEKGEV